MAAGELVHAVGWIAAVVMPLWNIPLIVRIERRRSASDLSLMWVLGVWVCILGMLPSALLSSDHIFKAFALINAVLFTGVVLQVIRYRHGSRP